MLSLFLWMLVSTCECVYAYVHSQVCTQRPEIIRSILFYSVLLSTSEAWGLDQGLSLNLRVYYLS